MPLAVALSPHLDDAVFSAGGTLARLVQLGWNVRLVTAFTASVPDPTGFALACQTDKGLSPDIDYMALRRDEDHAAAALLGIAPQNVHHLPFREAPHRGYESAPALFAGLHADDPLPPGDLADALKPHVADADWLLYPAAIGNHADHLLLLRAIAHLASGAPEARWLDTPYVLRAPDEHRYDTVVDIADTLGAKTAAACAYTTQIGFQFGGPTATADALRQWARHVAAAGGAVLAEPLRVNPDDVTRINAVSRLLSPVQA